MEDSTCVSCGHCVTVCPTGALVEKGIEDATTIPLPGFTQKNSIGKTYEGSEQAKGPMIPKKRAEHTEIVDSEPQPTDSETVDVDVWDSASGGGEWP